MLVLKLMLQGPGSRKFVAKRVVIRQVIVLGTPLLRQKSQILFRDGRPVKQDVCHKYSLSNG